MYIDGEWVDSSSGKTFASENPFNGELWASIPEADEQDAEKAISAARNAFDNEWHRVNGLQRAKLMNTLADLIDDNAGHLSRIETTDNGKVIRETETQMHYAARIYRFFAGYADKLYGKAIPLDHPSLFDYTIREPLGVVLLITAWNSPIALLANKLPPALAAGNTAGEMSKGYFIAPTVLTVTNDMSIAQTEVFGPVLSVIRFKNEDEAVRIANDTVYGLASGVWTSDLNRAHRMARAIQAGVVWINTYRSSAAQAPFGGYKQSGYGRERGEEALFDYTQVKNVMMDLSSNVRDPFLIKV
ncbi:MAG: aldehyde dehydrogenase family protein [Desulfobacterales bacterium]|nr:aldehyde dehydrogenase family protein [Desulfobacterales bacterium]